MGHNWQILISHICQNLKVNTDKYDPFISYYNSFWRRRNGGEKMKRKIAAIFVLASFLLVTFADVAPVLAKKTEIVITVKDYNTGKPVKNQEIVVILSSLDPRYDEYDVYTTGVNGKIVIDNSLLTYVPGIEYYLWIDY